MDEETIKNFNVELTDKEVNKLLDDIIDKKKLISELFSGENIFMVWEDSKTLEKLSTLQCCINKNIEKSAQLMFFAMESNEKIAFTIAMAIKSFLNFSENEEIKNKIRKYLNIL